MKAARLYGTALFSPVSFGGLIEAIVRVMRRHVFL